MPALAQRVAGLPSRGQCVEENAQGTARIASILPQRMLWPGGWPSCDTHTHSRQQTSKSLLSLTSSPTPWTSGTAGVPCCAARGVWSSGYIILY